MGLKHKNVWSAPGHGQTSGRDTRQTYARTEGTHAGLTNRARISTKVRQPQAAVCRISDKRGRRAFWLSDDSTHR